MSETKIEWTAVRTPAGTWVPGYTFNPWWGCVEVSPACLNCYARELDKRWAGRHWGKDAGFRFFGDRHWDQPRRWNERARKLGLPLRVFCGSMCDWLQDRPELVEPRARLITLIDETPALDWLMLTKRPENLDRLTPWRARGGAPANVMLGATVEDQRRADERIRVLLAFPTQRPPTMGRRFLSCEPLLGDIDLRLHLPDVATPLRRWLLDWVICGSESGHQSKVRETRDEWVESLRDQCAAAGVPFFLKQLQDPEKSRGRVVSLPVFQGRQHMGQPGDGA